MELKQDRLINLMQTKQMSYQDLADLTKINKATIHRYFTGITKKVPIERIWPIAFALDTTPQYLMGDTDDPSPNANTISSYIMTGRQDNEQELSFGTLPPQISIAIKRSNHDPQFSNLLNLINKLKTEEIKPVATFITILIKGDT